MGLREAGKEQRRRQILEAAASLIESDGIDALTMRRLAEDAGVSYATVYNLVGAKEDVLGALLTDAAAAITAELVALRVDDPLERADRIAATTVKVFVARPALYRPVVRAVHDPAMASRGAPIVRQSIAGYEAAIAEATERGDLSAELDRRVLAATVRIAVNSAIRRWAAGEIDDAQFAAEARYGLHLCLLGVTTPQSRERVLDQLRRCERTLRRRTRSGRSKTATSAA